MKHIIEKEIKGLKELSRWERGLKALTYEGGMAPLVYVPEDWKKLSALEKDDEAKVKVAGEMAVKDYESPASLDAKTKADKAKDALEDFRSVAIQNAKDARAKREAEEDAENARVFPD